VTGKEGAPPCDALSDRSSRANGETLEHNAAEDRWHSRDWSLPQKLLTHWHTFLYTTMHTDKEDGNHGKRDCKDWGAVSQNSS